MKNKRQNILQEISKQASVIKKYVNAQAVDRLILEGYTSREINKEFNAWDSFQLARWLYKRQLS